MRGPKSANYFPTGNQKMPDPCFTLSLPHEPRARRVASSPAVERLPLLAPGYMRHANTRESSDSDFPAMSRPLILIVGGPRNLYSSATLVSVTATSCLLQEQRVCRIGHVGYRGLLSLNRGSLGRLSIEDKSLELDRRKAYRLHSMILFDTFERTASKAVEDCATNWVSIGRFDTAAFFHYLFMLPTRELSHAAHAAELPCVARSSSNSTNNRGSRHRFDMKFGLW